MAYGSVNRERSRARTRAAETGRRLRRGVRALACLIFLLALTAAAGAAAEERAEALNASGLPNLNPTVDVRRRDRYSAILYDSRNGLASSEANAVARTSDGFIWIGSYSGLTQYDGDEFIHYPPSSGIASVVSLYVDIETPWRLWIGTNDNGLLENGSIRIWDNRDGLRSDHTRVVAVGADGWTYAATTRGVAVVRPDLTLQLDVDPRIDQSYIFKLSRGYDGLMYGLTL